MCGKRVKGSYLTSFSNATSVPGKRHTATFGSPIAANPRVMEFLNFVVRRGPDCSHTLKALLSPDMRRSGGKGRSKGSRTISWMEYRTLWGGVSVALILRFYPERVETKRGKGALSMVMASAKQRRRHGEQFFTPNFLLAPRSRGAALLHPDLREILYL